MQVTRLPDPSEVHVWFVELVSGGPSTEACFRTLSADERDRASRFRFDHLREFYTLSRGILRILAGSYLKIDPDRIRFAYGAKGKPRFAFPESTLEFNLAHSGEFAVYAFAIGCEVGVDIEKIRPVADQEHIVRRFFSPAESKDWLEVDHSERNEAFFRCWTRKEAYIKAVGDGLSMPLDRFRVSLKPGTPASLIHTGRDPDEARQWLLCSLEPPAGYMAALAMPDPNRIVRAMPSLTADGVLKSLSHQGLH